VTDENLTGPWVLALGVLAVGVAAIATELLRRRNEDSENRTRSDADDERARDSE